jgi:hypothetical protein
MSNQPLKGAWFVCWERCEVKISRTFCEGPVLRFPAYS